jgi:hypothetical protein
MESGEYPELRECLEDLGDGLRPDFPALQYSSKWLKGCRLEILVPMTDVDGAARTMKALIAATHERIEQALRLCGILDNDS